MSSVALILLDLQNRVYCHILAVTGRQVSTLPKGDFLIRAGDNRDDGYYVLRDDGRLTLWRASWNGLPLEQLSDDAIMAADWSRAIAYQQPTKTWDDVQLAAEYELAVERQYDPIANAIGIEPQ